MSIEKNIRIGERVNLKLRMDAFNAFNHPNFNTPNAAVTSPASFGTITSLAPGAKNRTVEFAGKISF
jgi:hypothetical protein